MAMAMAAVQHRQCLASYASQTAAEPHKTALGALLLVHHQPLRPRSGALLHMNRPPRTSRKKITASHLSVRLGVGLSTSQPKLPPYPAVILLFRVDHDPGAPRLGSGVHLALYRPTMPCRNRIFDACGATGPVGPDSGRWVGVEPDK